MAGKKISILPPIVTLSDNVTIPVVDPNEPNEENQNKKTSILQLKELFGTSDFTEDQVDRLKDLVYEELLATFSTSPTQFERGVSTPITLNYNIQSRDDTITVASINQGVGSVLDDVDEGASTTSGGNRVTTTAFTLTLEGVRKGDPFTQTLNATANNRVPQWAGVSEEEDFTTYAGIAAEESASGLQKFIQASASISKQSSPDDEYIWFISNKSNPVVTDQNGFTQTQGAWGSPTHEFWIKSLNLTLADDTTTSTVYLVRSRQKKTLINFTYNIA